MLRVENVLYDSITLHHGSYHSASSNVVSRHHMVRTSLTGSGRCIIQGQPGLDMRTRNGEASINIHIS